MSIIAGYWSASAAFLALASAASAAFLALASAAAARLRMRSARLRACT